MKPTHTVQSSGMVAVLAAALVTVFALAANSTPAKSAKQEKEKVKIEFEAVAGDTKVKCSKPITGLGSTDETADLSDLRFYVSDVKMIKKNGKSVPLKISDDPPFALASNKGDATLIDLENGKEDCAGAGTSETNSHVRGTVPAGKYVGAKWMLGLPPELNHTDVTDMPPPLDILALDWGWQYGRKFMQIEVTDPDGPGGTWPSDTFFVHVGSNGCFGDPAAGQEVDCSMPNRGKVKLKSFKPSKEKVAVDFEELFEGNDVTQNGGGAPGCMSEATDPECEGVFGALDIDWDADGYGTGQPGNDQSVFRAIKR